MADIFDDELYYIAMSGEIFGEMTVCKVKGCENMDAVDGIVSKKFGRSDRMAIFVSDNFGINKLYICKYQNCHTPMFGLESRVKNLRKSTLLKSGMRIS